jgi:hypothetical protein
MINVNDHHIKMDAGKLVEDDIFIQATLMGSDRADLQKVGIFPPSDHISTVRIGLSSAEMFSNDDEVQMYDKVIIRKNDEDIVSRMLKTDLKAYQALSEVIERKTKALLELGLNETSSMRLQQQQEWKHIEEKYCRHNIWRRVVQNLTKGTPVNLPIYTYYVWTD